MLDQIRPSYPDEVGFHHEVISSHDRGIYPVRKDGFSWKKRASQRLALFFLRRVDKKDAIQFYLLALKISKFSQKNESFPSS